MSIEKKVLYWSGFEAFEQCPQKYLWSYGWGSIDVGGGPGRRKPRPVQDSQHHPFMGTVIASVLERLYNDELWRDGTRLSSILKELTEKEFSYHLHHHYLDFDLMLKRESLTKQDLLATCHASVQGFLHTMKGQKLLGEYAKAELKMQGWLDKYTPIGGKADLIIRRQGDGISILDGKNSKSRGKYTNADQLRWYALCFYLEFNEMPDKLGFIYFRYPYGAKLEDGTVSQGVEWVAFHKDDIKGLALRVVDAYKKMSKEKFAPDPSPANCQFCAYESVCEARQNQKRQNARPARVDPMLSSDSDFTEFSLGGKK